MIRELAQSGNKIIFTTSFGYMNPTLKVAEQFRVLEAIAPGRILDVRYEDLVTQPEREAAR